MSLEAQTISDTDPIAPAPTTPPEHRRGRDRRKTDGRINAEAPRRSMMQRHGAVAVGVMLGLMLLSVVGSELLLDEPPWIAFAVMAVVLVTSVFAFMIGSIEQRLIEIRLELMMVNGGARQTDRRARPGPRSAETRS